MTETITDEEQPALFTTDARMCGPCLNGIGKECHTPGCAFYLCATPRTDLGTLRERFEGAGYTCNVVTPDTVDHEIVTREIAAKLIKLGERLRGPCIEFLKPPTAHGELLLEVMREIGRAAGKLDSTPLETEDMLPKCIACGWVVIGPERCPSCSGRIVP